VWSRRLVSPFGFCAGNAAPHAPAGFARRLLSLPLLALALATTVGFGPPSLTESDSAQMPLRRTQLQMMSAAQAPTGGAQASLIMDMETGRPVLERNARTRFAPASITKVMTALVVLEHAALQDRVKVVEDDLVEGSSMGLQVGDTVTVEQLLWGMLLPSGNDAAETLARYVGGGAVQRFVDMMNQKATTLQLTGTHFANPHGLDSADHYSTALDLAIMSRYAMQFPLFAQISATKDYTITANRPFVLRNTNQLLFVPNEVPGVTGVKTGYTDHAGDSLVASAERGGRRVLVVVLGTVNRSAAATGLIEFAYRSFAWAPPSPAGIDTARTPQPAAAAPVMVPLWQQYYVKYSRERLAQGPEAGPSTGPVAVQRSYVGRDELARQPLYDAHS